MAEKQSKNAVENLASHRIHGVLPKKYHMKYRSGQEELIEEKTLREIEQMIRQTSEDMDVPEGLLPENMERKLEFLYNKKKRRRRNLMIAGLILAVCIVIFVALAWKNRPMSKGYANLDHIYSYEQLYQYYVGLAEDSSLLYHGYNDITGAAWGFSSSLNGAMSSSAADTGSFTSTNVREEGIGESDFTVTDGKYIYTVFEHEDGVEEETPGVSLGMEVNVEIKIGISQVDGKKVRTVGTIHKAYRGVKGYGLWGEPSIYVYGDVLVLLCSGFIEENSWEQGTKICFYDVSDRSHPKLLKEEVQRGVYHECREVDGYLYVISYKPYIATGGLKREDESSYIPMIGSEKLSVQDIYFPKNAVSNAYEMISSWDLSEPGKCADVKALVGYYSNIYMTADNIYFANTVYASRDNRDETDKTNISKLTCEKGKIEGIATAYFPGTIDSSFAIQEHGDELWVTAQVHHYIYREDFEDTKYQYSGPAVNEWTDVSVHTFDGRLRSMDSLDGLVKNEEIYAVRYIGETGYFVSYEQTDPLVSIDLSDARHLKVLDELVMPGFSSYLHPVDDNLLLGVGQEDDGSIKLDLYDISNPRKLSRLYQEVLEDVRFCAVFWDYKWFMVDQENQLFGISMDGGVDEVSYYVYYYDRNTGLQLVKKVNPNSKNGKGNYFIWQGFHIGDYLYMVAKGGEGKIRVVELKPPYQK